MYYSITLCVHVYYVYCIQDHDEKEFRATPDKKMSDAFKSPLESLSPFCVEYEGRRYMHTCSCIRTYDHTCTCIMFRFSSLTDDAVEQNGLRNKVKILDPPPDPSESEQTKVTYIMY